MKARALVTHCDIVCRPTITQCFLVTQKLPTAKWSDYSVWIAKHCTLLLALLTWNSEMKCRRCEKCGQEMLHPQRRSNPVSVAAHQNSALQNVMSVNSSSVHPPWSQHFFLWWWKVLSLEQPLAHCTVFEVMRLSSYVPCLFLYLHPSCGKLGYMLY